MQPVIFQVATPSHLYRNFDYLPPKGIKPSDQYIGCRVWVPLRRRRVLAFIVGYGSSEVAAEKLQSIEQILDPGNVFGPPLYQLLLWAASYYCHPCGQVLTTALPALLRSGAAANYREVNSWQLTHAGTLQKPEEITAPRQRQALQALRQHQELAQPLLKSYGVYLASLRALAAKGWVSEHKTASKPVLRPSSSSSTALPAANSAQQQAIDSISASATSFVRHLLFGVTGSGKTLVFLKLIEKMLAAGGQALVLIPEIGLSPQTYASFAASLKLSALVLHSGLSDRERLDAWLAARAGDVSIIIGTRSALFSPFKDLRLIIVDEEQDGSYKQQDGLRYSARDLAIKYAQMLNIPIVLASATPALESWAHYRAGNYSCHELPQRAGSARPAQFRLVDVRGHKLAHGFSEHTIAAIKNQLQLERQVLVFVSRRGFAPVLQCFACGWLALCPACEQSLTLHRQLNCLLCHHCGHSQSIVSNCPGCGSIALKPLGVGSERGAQFLSEQFADYRVIRVDSDTMTKRSSFQQLHQSLAQPGACLLIGTQMLAKGHHFANLTLVVVQDIDAAFYSNDFFAQERVGQLILQVGGRAGRGQHLGEVLIQTRMPTSPLFRSLLKQDYSAFADALLQQRRQYQLAPFSYLAYVRAESKDPQHAQQLLTAMVKAIHKPSNDDLLVLEPIPALLPKRAYFFRFIVVIQSNTRSQRAQTLIQARDYLSTSNNSRVRWAIDVDPREGF